MVDFWADWAKKYPIYSIEDGMDENDWAGFSQSVAKLDKTIVLGDDLIVTDQKRLERAVNEKAVDGFILKPNQMLYLCFWER